MHQPPAIRPTFIEIDLDAVRANARLLATIAGSQVVAVVKADAYGHGVVPVARALASEPAVRGFAVSLVEEAVALRAAGVRAPVLIMGPALAGGHAHIVAHRFTPMVSCMEDLVALDAAVPTGAAPLDVHLMIDTGMSRLGFAPAELSAVGARLAGLRSVRVTGLCTHFACADTDDPGDPTCLTNVQIARFDEVCASAGAWGLPADALLHVANSAATLRFPGIGRDFVRVGLALYGNGPGPETPERGTLRPAMRLVSHVTQLRTVAAGSSVSYGALYRAQRDIRVAVLAVGYADGVPRRLTGRHQVLIEGRRCDTIGAITMGMIMVDVTELGERVQVGSPAVVIGAQGEERISVAEFATWAGCLEYEVTCGMGKRVPRVYKGGA